MERHRLVVLHGPKFSGKTAVARRLCEAHAYTVLSLASPLKGMLSAFMERRLPVPFVRECLYGSLKEEKLAVFGGKPTRYAMQILGNEVRDAIHQGMFAAIHDGRVANALRAGERVVVDDLRFHHEIPPLAARSGVFMVVESAAAAARSEIPATERIAEQIPGAYGPGVFEASDEDLAAMVSALLVDCGVGAATARRCIAGDLADAPIPLLGGKSAREAILCLQTLWCTAMSENVEVSPASTAAHRSEARLPQGLFSATIRNDGTIEDLHRAVDRVIAPYGMAA